MRQKFHFRAALTLLLALAAASLCVWLRTPLPWLIGPLLSVAVATILRARTESSTPLRNLGQCTIGAALGLYFTAEITAMVVSLWWAILICIAWAMFIGMGFGLWLQRLHAHRMPGLPRATTYFAGCLGGASEMTLLAERHHARTDLVAAAHSMRLVIVTVLIPFAVQFSGLHGIDVLHTGPQAVHWPGLMGLLLAAGGGAWLMARLQRPNPWFIGPLLVAMALTMAGVSLSTIPREISNAAQLLIGISLGVRFTPAFVHTAPRWLATVALGSVVMIVMSGGFAWALAWVTGLHPVTLGLATAPGGIAEMSITAKVLQLGAPMVTAFQVCRLIAVLMLVEPVYRRYFVKPAIA